MNVAGLFAYVAEGVVSNVSPNVGQLGTLVTITGERLQASGLGVARVTLAGVEAELLTETDTTVTVEVNSGDAKTGDVVLTADTEATVTLAGGFTYATAGVVDTVSPSTGQFGTRVEIAGSNLRYNFEVLVLRWSQSRSPERK